jgi:hypothetical protein
VLVFRQKSGICSVPFSSGASLADIQDFFVLVCCIMTMALSSSASSKNEIIQEAIDKYHFSH